MEDKKFEVPYIVYESEQARHERSIKRLLILLAVTVLLLFASNIVWLVYLSGYDYIETGDEVMLETRDGIANFIGQNGDINVENPGEEIQTGGS